MTREYRRLATADTLRKRLRKEAHLWLLELTGDASTPTMDILSPGERQRAESIRNDRARHHFVAGRILVRRALSRYLDVAPCKWRLDEADSGRPEISAPVTAPPLRFNLSHTDGLAACLITEAVDCGVDVERLDRRVDELGIAGHSFAAEELAALEALAPADRSMRFFALWTLKEAYLKARGSGIRLRLDAARFTLSAGREIEAEVPNDPDAGVRWQFSLFRPRPNHLLACAIRGGAAAGYTVCSWELGREGGNERLVDLTVVATTG